MKNKIISTYSCDLNEVEAKHRSTNNQLNEIWQREYGFNVSSTTEFGKRDHQIQSIHCCSFVDENHTSECICGIEWPPPEFLCHSTGPLPDRQPHSELRRCVPIDVPAPSNMYSPLSSNTRHTFQCKRVYCTG